MAEETRSVLGYVPPIHLVKKFTDTAQETTSLTSVSSTESSSTSSITSMPPLPTITDGVNMPTTEDSGSGLSTGAKIGIGVAVPLGALIAGAILFFIYTRRRRRAKGEDGMGSQAAALPLKYGSPEDLEDSSHYMPAAVELVGSQKPMSELPAQPREERIVHELPADNNPYPSK
ncbi:hypothetical protein FQN57_001280 [Myotisia sp. PD_48]|nr:hypothetical protein FQN57_001280 [Myotisia sp. PD_48]